MSKRIISKILETIDDVFYYVFPSEIVSQSLQIAVLEASKKKALPKNRFVGWDFFKNEVFCKDESKKPITSEMQRIFSKILMLENAKNPFLTEIVPREFADKSTRFSSIIAKALSSLVNIEKPSSQVINDWLLVKEKYNKFLEEKNLYDPAWNKKNAKTNKKWILFYPDLTTDYLEYKACLTKLPNVEIVLSDTLGHNLVKAFRFETSLQEIRFVLSDIRKRLENKTDPRQICISIANQDDIICLFEREAKIAGIPLDVREGKSLSNTSGGKLISDILNVKNEDFSFESLRKLLLDCSRPWKQPELIQELLQIGIENQLVSQIPGKDDVWELVLKSSVNTNQQKFYRGLKTFINNIVNAKTFSELKMCFDKFRNTMLDNEKWTSLQNMEISRCIVELDLLSSCVEFLKIDNAIQNQINPIAIYIEQLQKTKYLPVSSVPGISVYNYPTAAGISCSVHYVINLSDNDATKEARQLEFLPASERDKLSLVDSDLSAGLIRLLSESGNETILSFSTNGEKAPHMVLKLEDKLFDSKLWLPNIEDKCDTSDFVYPIQKNCASSAINSVFLTKDNDWTKGSFDNPIKLPECTIAIQNEKIYKDNFIKLSPTLIKNFNNCQFKYIFNDILKVEDSEINVAYIDNLLIGNIYHDAFKEIMKKIKELGIPIPGNIYFLDKEIGIEYFSKKTIKNQILVHSLEKGPMVEVLLKSAEIVLIKNFLNSLNILLENCEGQFPEFYDNKELEFTYSEEKIIIFGRADLVTKTKIDGNSVSIFDYKKSTIPSAKDFLINDDGSINEIQIPVYMVLLLKNNYNPIAGTYLSIEGHGQNVYLRKVFSPDDNKVMLEQQVVKEIPTYIKTVAIKTAKEINSKKIFIPNEVLRETVCENCNVKNLCRTQFIVR